MSLARLNTVMDTMDALRDPAEAQDLATQVRRLYDTQGLVVDEAVLTQAVTLCQTATSKSPTPPPPSKATSEGFSGVGWLLLGLFVGLSGLLGFAGHHLIMEFQANQRVVEGVFAPADTAQTLTQAPFQAALQDLDMTARELPASAPGQAAGLELSHASRTLAQRLIYQLPPTMDYRINGQLVHNVQETANALNACHDDEHCDLSDLTLTFQAHP